MNTNRKEELDNPDASSSELVILGKLSSPTEAHLLKVELEAEGIEAHVVDDHTAAITQMAMGVRVLVRPEDVNQALAIWNSVETLAGEQKAIQPLNIVDQDDDDDSQTAADYYLDGALKTAVFGLFFLPVQFYSIYLLLKLAFSPEKITKGQWKIPVTILLDCLLIVVIVSLCI